MRVLRLVDFWITYLKSRVSQTFGSLDSIPKFRRLWDHSTQDLRATQKVAKTRESRSYTDRYSSPFETNCFTEMCSGSEAGSYLRLKDLLYHSTLGLRVIEKRGYFLWIVPGKVTCPPDTRGYRFIVAFCAQKMSGRRGYGPSLTSRLGSNEGEGEAVSKYRRRTRS